MKYFTNIPLIIPLSTHMLCTTVLREKSKSKQLTWFFKIEKYGQSKWKNNLKFLYHIFFNFSIYLN